MPFSAILTSYQYLVPKVRFANEHSKFTAKTFMYEFVPLVGDQAAALTDGSTGLRMDEERLQRRN
jgi:hypothetical protein